MTSIPEETVYEQDADERVYPASLTKIMTCLIALENGNLSDVITIDEAALAGLDQDSSVVGLQVGEQITLENLLYCMMVHSGNDAANAVAEYIAGSTADFVRMMNERAYALGCKDTHFNNPHGLHDESHYTTARDLAPHHAGGAQERKLPADRRYRRVCHPRERNRKRAQAQDHKPFNLRIDR